MDVYIINFYRAMLCIRSTSHGPVSVCVCLSVSVSVTSRCSTKTEKRRITREIRPGSPPTGAPNAGVVGQNRRL